MRAIINFRPKVDPATLRKIAEKQNYPDLSGFINDAIEEKIRNIHAHPRDEKLMNDIKKAVYEFNGWSFSKPSAREAVEIRKRGGSARSGRTKAWPLNDVLKKLK